MRILVDAQKCCGCRICELQCSFNHTGKFSPRDSRIRVVKIDERGFDYPEVCHQCTVCSVVPSCPVHALSRQESGSIEVERDKCILCKKCADACRHRALAYDRTGVPILCDLCGGTPGCVERCPTKALTYAEGEEPLPVEVVFKELMRKWGISE